MALTSESALETWLQSGADEGMGEKWGGGGGYFFEATKEGLKVSGKADTTVPWGDKMIGTILEERLKGGIDRGATAPEGEPTKPKAEDKAGLPPEEPQAVPVEGASIDPESRIQTEDGTLHRTEVAPDGELQAGDMTGDPETGLVTEPPPPEAKPLAIDSFDMDSGKPVYKEIRGDSIPGQGTPAAMAEMEAIQQRVARKKAAGELQPEAVDVFRQQAAEAAAKRQLQ